MGILERRLRATRKLTPSAGSHNYQLQAFVDAGTGTVFGRGGCTGNQVPAFIRVTKA